MSYFSNEKLHSISAVRYSSVMYVNMSFFKLKMCNRYKYKKDDNIF